MSLMAADFCCSRAHFGGLFIFLFSSLGVCSGGLLFFIVSYLLFFVVFSLYWDFVVVAGLLACLLF